jgi:hypothetical protein
LALIIQRIQAFEHISDILDNFIELTNVRTKYYLEGIVGVEVALNVDWDIVKVEDPLLIL